MNQVNRFGSQYGTAETGVLITLYLLLVTFILPTNTKSFCSIGFACLLLIALLAFERAQLLNGNVRRSTALALLALLVSSLVVVAISPYSKNSLLVTTMFVILILALEMSFKGAIPVPKWCSAVFYYGAIFCIVVELLRVVTSGTSSFLQESYDKNYFGVVLFLFFCWCWNEKRVAGIVVCAIAALLIASRNYVIMILLFFLLELASKKLKFFKNNQNESLKPVQLFCVFVLMLVAIGIFSFWWSESMVGTSTVAVAQGWNDSSNAIRFNSDKYAFSYIIQHPSLVLYGYDSDIIQAMGLVDVTVSQGGLTAADGLFFNGYRIVQPHHVILNLILKEGVLYTIAYYVLLSIVLSPLLRKSNCSQWIPYMFACMFMHSLLLGQYLFFFYFMLKQSTVDAKSNVFSQRIKGLKSGLSSDGVLQ